MNTGVKNNRIAGLDLLRIFSIFGIICIHLLGQGGVLEASSSNGYYINKWFYIIFLSSVDIFALLSGYLSLFRKSSIKRTLELVATMLFYSIIIVIIFLCINRVSIVDYKTILKGLFPSIFGRYWYITCFLPILIFEPFINKCINALSIREHKIIVIVGIIIFCVVPSIFNIDVFKFESGYSLVWLLFLYLAGALIKRTDYTIKKIFLIIIVLAATTALLFINVCTEKMLGGHNNYLISYTSPFVVAIAISFLLLFKQIKFHKHLSVFALFSNSSFDIYLLHAHIYIFDFLLLNSFVWIANYNMIVQPLLLLSIGAAIYLACFLISFIRVFIFRISGLNKFLSFVTKKLNLFDVSDNN